MGFNIGSSIGGFLNDITGVTSASNQAFGQSKYLANLSFQQQKEFAQNAHQWEMEDLRKAGLNPALTAGGTSAGAIAGSGSTGNSGSVGSSAMNPLGLIDAINTTRATSAQNKKAEQEGNAQEMYGLAQLVTALTGMKNLPWIDKKNQAEIDLIIKKGKEAVANAQFQNERARGYSETNSTTTGNSDNNDSGWSFGLTGVSHKKGKGNSATHTKTTTKVW